MDELIKTLIKCQYILHICIVISSIILATCYIIQHNTFLTIIWILVAIINIFTTCILWKEHDNNG